MNESIIKALNLSEEQREIYKDLSKRESCLRSALLKCGVHQSAIQKIIDKSDITKVDTNNLELLEESIKQEWADLISEKAPQKTFKELEAEYMTKQKYLSRRKNK